MSQIRQTCPLCFVKTKFKVSIFNNTCSISVYIFVKFYKRETDINVTDTPLPFLKFLKLVSEESIIVMLFLEA